MSQRAETPFNVFVVDEHPVVLSCLSRLLAGERDMRVCGVTSTLEGTAQRIGQSAADVLVVDIAVGHLAGLELVETVRKQHPSTRVVCYSVLDESVFAERALRAGAAAYVMKTSDFPVLLTAIRSVHGGGLFLSEEMRGRMLQRLATATRRSQAHNFSALSNRELQVVYHIGEQRGVDEIARRLSSTSQSISVHRSRIKVKLGIRSLGDLMRFATRWVEADAGVVDPCPAPAR